MARQWVVNNASGPRMIAGKMLEPGEGTWVVEDQTFYPSEAAPQLRLALTATQVAVLAVAGMPVAPGVLLCDPSTGLLYGQSDGVGGYVALGGGAFDVASQEEAEAGENNTKGMTPLRTAQAIAAQAASGVSGATGSGGGDIVAATLVSGGAADGQIATYTDDVPHTVARDGGGVPTTDTIVTGFASTLTAGPGNLLRVTAGIRRMGGAIRCTFAEREVLRAALEAATITIDAGTLFFVTDVGLFIEADGTTNVPGWHCRWNGRRFAWCDGGVAYRDCRLSSGYTGASESGVLRNITVPIGIASPRDAVAMEAVFLYTNGPAAASKTSRVKLNSNSFCSIATVAGTNSAQHHHYIGKRGRYRGAYADGLAIAAFSVNGESTSGGTTGAEGSIAVNNGTTALSFDATVNPTEAACQGWVRDLCVIVGAPAATL